MPRYRLTETAFVDDRLRDAGEEISFEGIPGPHMDPLDKEARKARADAEEAASRSLPLNAVPIA